MKMRLTAALCTLMLLCAGALAEQQTETIEPETVRAVVEAMMRAAIGADFDDEERARKDMPPEEQMLRSEALAQHRRVTIPWVMASFGATEETILDYLYPEEEAEITATPTPLPTPRPAWEPQAAYDQMLTTYLGWEYVSLLEQMGASGAEACLALTQEICDMWLAQIDHEALRRTNKYYSAWIYAPDTQIDYPIVHGPENSYWLYRLFNGGYNSAGTLFFDYRNLEGFRDPNTLLYGHNMRNNSMFGDLTEYQQQAYFDTHPWHVMITEEKLYIAEAMAGYATKRDDHCYDIAISGEKDFIEFVDAALRKTDFVLGASAKPGDKLLTLSTCAYMFDNARYIVIDKLTLMRKFEEIEPTPTPTATPAI